MGKIDAAFKLIGKLGGQNVYRRIVDIPVTIGLKNSKGYTRNVLFRFVNNAGQVTKEVARDVVDHSSIRKSAMREIQKDGWTKNDKIGLKRECSGASWRIKGNEKSTDYTYSSYNHSFRKYMKQRGYEEEVFVRLTDGGKNVGASQIYAHSDLFPHLDINKLQLELHKFGGDISEYLKGLHS